MILPLSSVYVIWALPRGDKAPFEVSREVALPIQPECPTSPYCPGERSPRIRGRKDELTGRRISEASWVYNGEFRFSSRKCPYSYPGKDDCYRDINRLSLKAGCFPATQLLRAGNLLKSLGYEVFAEEMSAADLDGNRILVAHGPIYGYHELRVERGPGMIFYMIRNPDEGEVPAEAFRL